MSARSRTSEATPSLSTTKGRLVKFERQVRRSARPAGPGSALLPDLHHGSAESVAEALLTPSEFAVMAYINGDVGEPDIDLTSLAERIGIDRNNASLLVERLVSKGLVDRREND